MRTPPTASLTAIVAAMPEEMAPLRARATGLRHPPGAGLDVMIGRLGDRPVALAVTGDGERNARRGLAVLLAAGPVERVVAIGVAGGLSPGLGEGSLVVARWVVSERGVADGAGAASAENMATATGASARLRAEPSLVAWAVRATGARPGVIVSADRIADSVAEKRRLLLLAGAGDAPAVVDLESASYAATAEHMGIPWVMLRAVSDGCDEALPPLLNRCRDAGGAVRRGAVARGLLTDPGALPVLLALRRRVRQYAAVLATSVEALLRASADIASTTSPPSGGAPGGV
jgi:nucleoside phosphorylase